MERHRAAGEGSPPAGAPHDVIRPLASLEELDRAGDVIGAQMTPPFTHQDGRFGDLVRRFAEDRPLMLVVQEVPPPAATRDRPVQGDPGGIVGGALAFRTGPRAVTLRMIGLAPRVRGRGLGRRLLAALELAAVRLGATAISLGADDGVKGFYSRQGYVGRGTALHKGLPLPGPFLEARLRKLAGTAEAPP